MRFVGSLVSGCPNTLNLKENWHATHAAVQAAFAAASPALRLRRSETIDADHGRIETRRHTVRHEIDWLSSDRRCSHKLFDSFERFP